MELQEEAEHLYYLKCIPVVFVFCVPRQIAVCNITKIISKRFPLVFAILSRPDPRVLPWEIWTFSPCACIRELSVGEPFSAPARLFVNLRLQPSAKEVFAQRAPNNGARNRHPSGTWLLYFGTACTQLLSWRASITQVARTGAWHAPKSCLM